MWHHLWFFQTIFLTTEVGRPCREKTEVDIFLPSGLFASSGWHSPTACVSFRHPNWVDVSATCHHVVWDFLGWRLWPASRHIWPDKSLTGSCQSSADNGLFPHVPLYVPHLQSTQWSMKTAQAPSGISCVGSAANMTKLSASAQDRKKEWATPFPAAGTRRMSVTPA